MKASCKCGKQGITDEYNNGSQRKQICASSRTKELETRTRLGGLQRQVTWERGKQGMTGEEETGSKGKETAECCTRSEVCPTSDEEEDAYMVGWRAKEEIELEEWKARDGR